MWVRSDPGRSTPSSTSQAWIRSFCPNNITLLYRWLAVQKCSGSRATNDVDLITGFGAEEFLLFNACLSNA